MQTHLPFCYRLRPYFRNVGIAVMAISTVLGLVSVVSSYFNVDGSLSQPVLAAAVFGVFWSCFLALGCWLFLAHRRYRLLFDGSALQQVGVVSGRTIKLQAVDELKWRRFPVGGSVRLAAAEGILKIELGNFEEEQRENLIALLRDRVDRNRQVGWLEFHEQFKDSPEKKSRSLRSKKMLIVVFGLHAMAFFALWAFGFGSEYAFYSAINALFTGYLIRSGRSDEVVPEETIAPSNQQS